MSLRQELQLQGTFYCIFRRVKERGFMSDCIFVACPNKEIPTEFLYEDENVVALMT